MKKLRSKPQHQMAGEYNFLVLCVSDVTIIVPCRSPDGSVTIATGYRLHDGSSIPGQGNIFLFSVARRSVLS
jgi:hypothetical protein